MQRVLIRAAIVLLLLCVGLAGMYVLWSPAALHHRHNPLRTPFVGNAVWARYMWFTGVEGSFDRHTSPYEGNPRAITREEVTAFGESLLQNRIRDVFIFTGSLDPDGRYPLWPLEDIRSPALPTATFSLIRDKVPGVRLLAWVGGIHAGFPRGQMDLGNPAVRAAAAALCLRLVSEADFDGVHLNIEPARNDDEAYIALLKEVRAILPPGKALSVAGPDVFPRVPPTRAFTDHFWDVAYTARVAAFVDQVAFMTYDTFMPFRKLHQGFLRYETKTTVRAVRMGNPNAEVLLGVPTYDDYNISHVRDVETIDNTLVGIRAGLVDLGDDSHPFAGIAIYANWTTDAEEWNLYRSLWLGDADRGKEAGSPDDRAEIASEG